MQTATMRACDRAKLALGGVSDYRLAKVIGVNQQTMSKYRTGARQMDEGPAVRVAKILRMPPEQLLAEIQAERSKDHDVRAAWLRLARLASPALAVVAAILAGFLGSPDAMAGALPYSNQGLTEIIHTVSAVQVCILCQVVWRALFLCVFSAIRHPTGRARNLILSGIRASSRALNPISLFPRYAWL